MKSITITIVAFLTAFLLAVSFPTKVQAVSCTWNGTNSSWGDKNNWDCNKVPGSDDDVYISSGTVNLDEGVRVKSLTLSDGTLTGEGNLIAEKITWTGGLMSGSGSTTATNEANFTGFNYLVLDGRTFNNAGTATFNWPGGSGFLYLYTPETEFNNQMGATFTIQSSSVMKVIGGTGTFNNEGRFILDSLDTTVLIGATLVNTNPGLSKSMPAH